MTTINLKDFYYWYIVDELVEVPDEVAEALMASRRDEASYQRRLTRNKAFYSLDCDDGIEYSACLHEPSPQELLDRKELFFRLWNALNSLPEIQGRRVDAHLILGKSYRQIAREEGVDKSAVRCSVESGIKRMKKIFERKFLITISICSFFFRGYMRGSFSLSVKGTRGPQATVPGRLPLCGGSAAAEDAVL